MRISDWSSDVCSSDLVLGREDRRPRHYGADLLVDRGDARIDLVGNVGLARPFVLEPVGFLAESRELRLVLVGERRLFAVDDAHAVIIGAIGRASGRGSVCQYV